MIAGIVAGAALAAGGTPTPTPSASTLSPNWHHTNITLSNGNLTAANTDGNYGNAFSQDGKISGKWYFEVTVDALGTSSSGGMQIGISHLNRLLNATGIDGSATWGYSSDGDIWGSGASSGIGTYGATDIISVAVDADARTVMWRKNGGSWTSTTTITGSHSIQPWCRLNWNGAQVTFNFGATAFAYAPPMGYDPWTQNNADLDARYWRIYGFNDYWSIAEAYLRLTSAGANQIGSGTTSASSSYGSNLPALAVDGNSATFWASNNGSSAWWQYDFGSGVTKAIREVAYQNRSDFAGQYARQVVIAWSNDGAAFTPCARTNGLTWTTGEVKTFTVPSL